MCTVDIGVKWSKNDQIRRCEPEIQNAVFKVIIGHIAKSPKRSEFIAPVCCLIFFGIDFLRFVIHILSFLPKQVHLDLKQS